MSQILAIARQLQEAEQTIENMKVAMRGRSPSSTRPASPNPLQARTLATSTFPVSLPQSSVSIPQTSGGQESLPSRSCGDTSEEAERGAYQSDLSIDENGNVSVFLPILVLALSIGLLLRSNVGRTFRSSFIVSIRTSSVCAA